MHVLYDQRLSLFLLSPAWCGGRRAQMLTRQGATHQLALRLDAGTLTLGEAFAFMSGLYFRGKLAYATTFADRGRPPELAGLAPFCLLLAGAAHWYQPRSEGWMPAWGLWPFDALAIGIVIWNVVELGFARGRMK